MNRLEYPTTFCIFSVQFFLLLAVKKDVYCKFTNSEKHAYDSTSSPVNSTEATGHLGWICYALKVATHEGTSPYDWSLRLVPCSVYSKEIVAGTSPLKGLKS